MPQGTEPLAREAQEATKTILDDEDDVAIVSCLVSAIEQETPSRAVVATDSHAASELMSGKLRGAGSRTASVCEAKLRGADAAKADLHGAELSGTYLCWADLHGANLREADVREADLSCADLRETDLRGANLDWAIPD